jgi:predicted RNase H-like HicB family nuclease
MTTMRQVVISPGEDGYFVAEVPSLPGCISQGRTRAEAIANIREAIGLMIEVLEEQGKPVPEDTLERQLVVV